MNLFELFVKVGVDDQASGKLSALGEKLGNGLKTAAKVGTAAVSVAAAGITALTTAAVNNYAEYEQLVGGVETLFKDSADTVMEYAENAYKTAGMSANEYMSTVTGFSAALLRSVGGDTEKAAKLADTAITDMSDNANKMGVSLESLQNAYTGFSRGNFTMLDNLALGFSGTKEGMQELLDTAEELSGVEYDIESYADIVEAIHVVQTEMGITGTTAKEAGATIAGSVGAMKSAWSNLITGLADGNADIGRLVDNLVTTIVGDGTEANLGVLGNVMPAVKTALNGASKLVRSLLPQIVKEVPAIINDNLHVMAEAAISVIQSLMDGISENQGMLTQTAFETITFLATSLISMLPQVAELGLNLLVSLANGIAQNIGSLTPTVVEIVVELVRVLTDPSTLSNMVAAALAISVALSEGLIDAIPQLVDAVPVIIEDLINTIVDNLPLVLSTGVSILLAVGEGVLKAIPDLLEVVPDVISGLVGAFKELLPQIVNIGKDLVTGVWSGIVAMKDWISEKVKGFFSGIVSSVKGLLGIHSPSKVFSGIGRNMALGLGDGWGDSFGSIKRDIEDSLQFSPSAISLSPASGGMSGNWGAGGGTTFSGLTININGARYSDENALADAVAARIQALTERRAAVYGI